MSSGWSLNKSQTGVGAEGIGEATFTPLEESINPTLNETSSISRVTYCSWVYFFAYDVVENSGGSSPLFALFVCLSFPPWSSRSPPPPKKPKIGSRYAHAPWLCMSNAATLLIFVYVHPRP